jgi:hypothetical protein
MGGRSQTIKLNQNAMNNSKKKPAAKTRVKFKDLKSKKNPKGGFQYDLSNKTSSSKY